MMNDRAFLTRGRRACVAASAVAMCVSTQLGAQWKLIEPPNPGPISSFGVADDNPDIVYVATNPDGAWQTNDGGATDLARLFSGMGLHEIHVTAVPSAPGNNQRRYMMVIGGLVRTTANGGRSWTGASNAGGQPHVNRPWISMAISPVNDRIVLTGGDGVIMRSTNAASSWTAAERVPNDIVVTDVEYVQGTHNDSIVWAATSNCGGWADERECADLFDWKVGSHGVLYSLNGGLSWVEILIDPDRTNPKNFVNAVATIPGWPSRLLTATDEGLWATGDAGGTWSDLTPLTLQPRRITDVFYAPSPNPTIYIGTEQGVWRGDVRLGVSWTQLTSFPIDFVTALGSTISTSDLLYVGYENGEPWTTRTGGAAANPMSGAHGAYPLSTIAIKSDEENTIYTGTVCGQGIFKGIITSPGNPSWSVMERNFGQFTQHFHYVMRLTRDPSDGNITYATDDNSVWRTTDAGANWFNMQNFGLHTHGLAVAPSNPSRLYLSNGYGNWGGHTPTLFVWRSDNQGVTWTDVTNNLPQPGTETSMFDIAVSPIDDDVVYIATFGAENYPLYSPPHGVASLTETFRRAVLRLFGREGGREDGEGQGVMRTLDGGQTWERINAGLAPSDDNLSWWVGKVAMSARDATLTTYIATLDGLYKMVRADATTWQDISPADGSRRFESIAVDPANDLILYAGTSETDKSGAATIYQSVDGGDSWSPMTMQMAPRAWADQYRVRDIQVGGNRAYAVVEGSGIYLLDRGDSLSRRHR